MGKFRELNVWRRAKDLAVYIYRETSKGPFSKDFGLRDQIRRATVSIASNVAEGDELGTDKQSIRSFHIARGSSAETLTQAIIALEIGYFSEGVYEHVESECRSISAMLTKLIQSRSRSQVA